MGKTPILALLAVLSLVFIGTANASRGGHVCGFIHASVPYSQHGSRHRWRVYIGGDTTCHEGEKVLSAVMHLGGVVHQGSSEASSFITLKSWRCPFGNMGTQLCEIRERAPFLAQALAVNCAENPCPSSRTPSDFPGPIAATG